MKFLTKQILIASLLTAITWGAEKPADEKPNPPVLTIAAFTMKSDDGTIELTMDDQGKVVHGGKHIATAHANGEITKPGGGALLRLKADGKVEPANFCTDVTVSKDGTLKGGGESHGWVDGKFKVGDKGALLITPKDSPSKPIATLLFLTLTMPVEVKAE